MRNLTGTIDLHVDLDLPVPYGSLVLGFILGHGHHHMHPSVVVVALLKSLRAAWCRPSLPIGKNIRWYAVGYRRSVVDLDTVLEMLLGIILYIPVERACSFSFFCVVLTNVLMMIADGRSTLLLPTWLGTFETNGTAHTGRSIYRRQTRYTTRINIRTEVSTVPLGQAVRGKDMIFFLWRLGGF